MQQLPHGTTTNCRAGLPWHGRVRWSWWKGPNTQGTFEGALVSAGTYPAGVKLCIAGEPMYTFVHDAYQHNTQTTTRQRLHCTLLSHQVPAQYKGHYSTSCMRATPESYMPMRLTEKMLCTPTGFDCSNAYHMTCSKYLFTE